MERELFEVLKKYGESDYYPLHMPGHKRNFCPIADPYSIDVTEIYGFDNLFHAEDILLEAQKRAARLYHSDETFYLVNGSTCGILAAVSASTRRGGQILMARNCHKAAYHAVLLNGLRVTYLYPSANMEFGMNGSISVQSVKEALDAAEGKIQAVLITSPTYDGVVSDVEKIAEVVHEAGAVLIVDEAHGAHFAMDDFFPQSSLALGADLVINSIHKTMPSLTQTALLHVKGERADRQRLKRYLGIYQSSSPSYVLMSGIDACVNLMLEQKEELFDTFTQRLTRLRNALKNMKVLHLVDGTEAGLNAFAYDCSKVIISTEKSSINGPELGRILREDYHMEAEMEAEQYVTAIMTVADTQEGFERLERALVEVDTHLVGQPGDADCNIQKATAENGDRHAVSENVSWQTNRIAGHEAETVGTVHHAYTLTRNEEVLTIGQAEDAPKQKIRLSESGGRISAEFVYLYPPGIPILVPGERIPENMPEQIGYYRSIGLSVQGMEDYVGEYIWIIEETILQ